MKRKGKIEKRNKALGSWRELRTALKLMGINVKLEARCAGLIVYTQMRFKYSECHEGFCSKLGLYAFNCT